MTISASFQGLRVAPIRVPCDEPELWWVDTAANAAAEDLSTAARTLGPGEIDRATAFATPQLRREYLVAHVAVRLILGWVLGTDPAAVPLGRRPCTTCGGPHGQPMVIDHPVEYSLARTPGLALIGVADRPLGVDVERVPELADHVIETLHPEERAELVSLPKSVRSQRFAQTWTRKEAYLKGLGIGLRREPQLDLIGAGAEATRRVDDWWITDVAVPPGFAAASAVRDQPSGGSGR